MPHRTVTALHAAPHEPSEEGMVSPKSLWHLLLPVRVKTEQEGSLPGTSVPSPPKPQGAPGSVPRQRGLLLSPQSAPPPQAAERSTI